MKILISADIEGASGVASLKETGYPARPTGDPETKPDYLNARHWLTADINAAVEGALEAGATRFVLHDSHGTDYRNVDLNELHPAVEVVRGIPIVFYEESDLDKSFDAAFMIGMHARAGEAGLISHVLDWPRITAVRINNLAVSESHITVELAGAFGIPTVLITGDDTICAEISEWSGDNIEPAVVKYSLSRYAARCLPLGEAHATIKEAARRGVERAKNVQPSYLTSPYVLEVDLIDREAARYASWMPGVEYDGNRTITYRHADFLHVYHALVATFWISLAQG